MKLTKVLYFGARTWKTVDLNESNLGITFEEVGLIIVKLVFISLHRQFAVLWLSLAMGREVKAFKRSVLLVCLLTLVEG